MDPDGTFVDGLGPIGLRSTIIDQLGKIIDHKNDGDNSIYQLINDRKVKIGNEKEGIDYNQLIGKQLGALQYDPKSFDLKEVQVTAKKPNSALGAIGIGLALRTGGLWGAEGLDPEPVTKTVGAIALTAYSAYVLSQEAVDYYYNKNKAEELDRRIDALAHKKKKQSSGKKPDRHDRQYTHGGKNRNKNPNQKKGAEKRRNNGKEEN